jgi:hypothetical protein
LEDIQVTLLTGADLAGTCRADDSGEFALEFEEQERVPMLFVDVRGHLPIGIHLPGQSE